MFFQACCRDDAWLCEPPLPELLALIDDLRHAGDVAVWQGERVIVVCHADGTRTWLAPEHKPAEAA
jgi:hypothetical protein